MFASESQILSYLDLIIQRCDLFQLFKFVCIYPNIINNPEKLKIIASNLCIKYENNISFLQIMERLHYEKILDITFELNNCILLKSIDESLDNYDYEIAKELFKYLTFKIDKAINQYKLYILINYIQLVRNIYYSQCYSKIRDYNTFLLHRILMKGDIEIFNIFIDVYSLDLDLILSLWNYISNDQLRDYILLVMNEYTEKVQEAVSKRINRRREKGYFNNKKLSHVINNINDIDILESILQSIEPCDDNYTKLINNRLQVIKSKYHNTIDYNKF
jgi:hypothetical protein